MFINCLAKKSMTEVFSWKGIESIFFASHERKFDW